MGIARGALKFVFEEGKRERWHGRALTLGRQETGFSLGELLRAAEDFRYPLNSRSSPGEDGAGDHVSPDVFFQLLGFDGIDVLDASNFDGANILHDLNAPVPAQLEQTYDLIFDGGTIEHVFDIATALRSLCRMVKTGGRILHLSPMANCPDHGFYCFNPTLFADFYSTNDFQVERLAICRFKDDPSMDDWEYLEYEPKQWGTLGKLDDRVYFLAVSAKRQPHSTWNRSPQQAYYREHVWRQKT